MVKLSLNAQVETDLLNNLPKWEEANGRPFMVQGERVVDKIHDARNAKEEAKEAKKVRPCLDHFYALPKLMKSASETRSRPGKDCSSYTGHGDQKSASTIHWTLPQT